MAAADRTLLPLALMWTALAAAPALAGDCQVLWDPATVDASLERAEAAFADLDIPAFLAASDEARERLRCVNTLMPTPVVARMHRVEGLRAFGERDVFAVRAFAAARALDPNYQFPATLVPRGSPIHDDWDAMDLAAGGLTTLAEPRVGVLTIDGIPTSERPDAWPSLVQLLGGDGDPVFSAYLHHDEAAPAYELAEAPAPGPLAPSPAPVPVPVARSAGSPRVPLLVGAGATALTTGVLVALGASSRSSYFDVATPDDELDGLRARTNGLAAAATVTGVATVGLGVGVAITW